MCIRDSGGAIGSIQDVKLVIITAEPGDPPNDANYHGTAMDMLQNSFRVFSEAMERGSLNRTRKPSPFHRNMLHILEYFFSGQDLKAKLQQTWTTNAVLCTAKYSGGMHLDRVESTCANTYLVPQLALLKHTFVLVLGNKARDRLVSAGLHYDMVARHPSSRVSYTDKHNSWLSAAELFHRRNPTSQISKSTSADSPERLSKNKITKRSQRHLTLPEGGKDLSDPLLNLSAPIAAFFAHLERHPDYSCKIGRMQWMVYFRGEKVGGFNPRAPHFYLSKVFVHNHGTTSLMEQYAFRHAIHNEKHHYWQAPTQNALEAFKTAVTHMTGIPFLM